MRTPEADELDLPPIDGVLGTDDETDDHEAGADAANGIELDDHGDLGDPLDDATADADIDANAAADAVTRAAVVHEAETGWLTDAEEGATLDIGPFDVSLSEEGDRLAEDDHEEPKAGDLDLVDTEETVHADGGEEGPVDDDEELREEDLPALDADEDGDVEDESLYERGVIEQGEELRWDDRAWARAPLAADGAEDSEDSGMLAVPSEDPKLSARDATWRRLEETGRITAASFVPGESVVVALDAPERPVLVRISSDGVARIIAEIETAADDDEVEACRVTGLRWDPTSGCLVVSGTFGTQAFRPA